MPKQKKPTKVPESETIVVGKVSPKERDEMQALYERKNGLLELIQSLSTNGSGMLDNDAFYEKVVADLGRTTTLSRKWWDEKSKAYRWPGKPGWQWSIDFESCQISLNRQKKHA